MPFRLRIQNGGADTVLREEYVGSSSQRICYPGISSCIAITGVLSNGLVGTHITIATEIAGVDQLLQTMKTGGGSSCPNFYVIGAFTRFKSGTREGTINTRKKISKKIKSVINKSANVRFYDSSAHGDVHVFVEKNQGNIDFSWISSSGNIVSGSTYPAFAGRTVINANQFVVR